MLIKLLVSGQQIMNCEAQWIFVSAAFEPTETHLLILTPVIQIFSTSFWKSSHYQH